MSAAILVERGYSVDDAFQMVEMARDCPVPDTEAQRQWVGKYAAMKEMSVAFALE